MLICSPWSVCMYLFARYLAGYFGSLTI
uniref:Uncharacterized protein n=1 Tax=Arundo donax TaxID=35708 RepID=A0A0A9HDY1_ARUDO